VIPRATSTWQLDLAAGAGLESPANPLQIVSTHAQSMKLGSI
jgi:hypothetical protein